MGNGWIQTTVKVAGIVLLGLMPAACDRSTPNAANPANQATEDESTSIALDAVPPSPEDPTAPPPPPSGAFLAQLSPEQVAQLTSLGIDVVVPGTVPPSFQVVDLRITQGDMGLSYLIVYQNADSQCFAVEYVDDGVIPPLATENRQPIKPPLFTDENGNPSYSLNYGQYSDPEWRAKFPEPNLYTDWLAGPSGYYRLTGAANIKELFANLTACQDLAPETAVALVESFTLITSEPMGTEF